MKTFTVPSQKIYTFGNNISINNNVSPTIHKHSFDEIHVVAGGEISFLIDNKSYILKNNSAILIPSHTLHSAHTERKPLKHIAFMSDCVRKDVIIKTFSPDLISELFSAVENEMFNDICNCLFFVRNKLYSQNIFEAEDTLNYAVQITEFFSQYYSKNIHISDLAKELHVSPMQAQRLSKLHTGKTFGENLLIQRMLTADELMKTSDMALQEISTYVGYASYSGFYKAYKKYKSFKSHSDFMIKDVE